MKRSMLVPAILVLSPSAFALPAARAPQAPKQAARTAEAVVLLQRDARGKLKAAPRACIDLSAPNAFISDDTVRAKKCPPAPARPAAKK